MLRDWVHLAKQRSKAKMDSRCRTRQSPPSIGTLTRATLLVVAPAVVAVGATWQCSSLGRTSPDQRQRQVGRSRDACGKARIAKAKLCPDRRKLYMSTTTTFTTTITSMVPVIGAGRATSLQRRSDSPWSCQLRPILKGQEFPAVVWVQPSRLPAMLLGAGQGLVGADMGAAFRLHELAPQGWQSHRVPSDQLGQMLNSFTQLNHSSVVMLAGPRPCQRLAAPALVAP